jgi:hypothetical protein
VVQITTEKLRDSEPIRMAAEAHFESLPELKVWFTTSDAPPGYGECKTAIIGAFEEGEKLKTSEIVLRVTAKIGGAPKTVANAVTYLYNRGVLKRVNNPAKGMEAVYERA